MEAETKKANILILICAILAGLLVWFLIKDLKRPNTPSKVIQKEIDTLIIYQEKEADKMSNTASSASKNSKEIIKSLPKDKPVVKDTSQDYMERYIKEYKQP